MGLALQNEGERVEQLHLWVRLRGRRMREEPAAPEDFQRGDCGGQGRLLGGHCGRSRARQGGQKSQKCPI